jgi:hypothetical protein
VKAYPLLSIDTPKNELKKFLKRSYEHYMYALESESPLSVDTFKNELSSLLGESTASLQSEDAPKILFKTFLSFSQDFLCKCLPRLLH